MGEPRRPGRRSIIRKRSQWCQTRSYDSLSRSTTFTKIHEFTITKGFFFKARDVLVKYSGFIGPGFLIAVAYIDPGNYATDVEAGAATRYKHLFIILMSNLFAIFLQSLCIKLGTVTGLNLAENCRKHLPKWLTITLYIFAESAIIATDIAEVSLSTELPPVHTN